MARHSDRRSGYCDHTASAVLVRETELPQPHMTETSDDRSWWADVEHLRPGAQSTTTPTATVAPMTVAEPDFPRAGDGEESPIRRSRITRTREADESAPASPVRRGRIAGRPLPSVEPPAVLRRSDAAFLADAMDFDGAFSTPVRRGAESREIVLSARGRSGAEIIPADEPEAADRPAVRGKGSPDRPTVRITGNPGVHAEIAERRALREIEGRRPRTTAERVGHHPDRIAMWAVFLGIMLVLIAATSSSGIS